MKIFSYKRGLAALLAICMTTGAFTGCSNSKGKVPEEDSVTETTAPEVTGQIKNVADNSFSLLSSINDNFDSAVLSEDYNRGMYNLPNDYVFEFECSDKASYRSYDVFKVYATQDYTNAFRSYNKNTVENGKIKVAPEGIVELDENGSHDVSNGTWGSLNQLYLVQFIDLETGEDLEKPIVTPFTVKHELNSPAVSQGVDEKNNYRLSWNPVDGASKYAVFEHINGCAYNLCCTTSDTSVTVEEFKQQKESEEFIDLVKKDLSNAGYEVDNEGIAYMNSAVRYNDNLQDGYFTVIALGSDGKSSGISNIVDVRDIASSLPYTVKSKVLKKEISSINDVPEYVDVEMVDGSVAQMIIDYHGGQGYKYPDEPEKISIKVHIANTLFDSFYVSMTGMLYEDVASNMSIVLEREDKLLENVKTGESESGAIELISDDPENNTANDPDKSETVTNNEQITEPVTETEKSAETEPVTETEKATETEPETEKATETEPVTETEKVTETEPVTETEKVTETESSKPSSENLSFDDSSLGAVAPEVEKVISELGKDEVDKVLYAETKLGAWIAYCVIAQAEEIPVPTSLFPEAANTDYLFRVFLEAYRQNPTSGVIDINSIKYNTYTETLLIPYCEETEVRLDKTKQELAKAEEVVAAVINDSMTDYDKVLALNNYFCQNAAYDHDSASTSVDINSVSESFIDAHTPYGILCKDYGVCESYSEAFILTSRIAGLESICEIGKLFGGGHEWNRVKVDGNWCVLDVTNNDNEYFVNGLFNLSDKQIEGILVPEIQAVTDASKFAANSENNEYYYVSQKYASDMEKAKQLFRDALNSENQVTFRLPWGTSKEEADQLIRDLISEGVKISKSGYQFGLLTVFK